MFISPSSLALRLFFVWYYASLLPSLHALAASKWQTLSGAAPIVVARGGLSGYFPDSSQFAFAIVPQISVPGVVVLCDVQLTKNNTGICAPNVDLHASTNISAGYPNRNVTYTINGVPTNGWFSLDYTEDQLASVTLVQWRTARPPYYDTFYPLQYVEDAAKDALNASLWLNFEHDAFYAQHKLSVRDYVRLITKRVAVSYISSPEIGFLKSIANGSLPRGTKLVFKFLKQEDVEPTTNQTYGSLLSNLTSIKAFSYGILVPKAYIWPVDEDMYTRPYTSLVLDAHKAGLMVFAYEFLNDYPFAYNYSYDPAAELLSHVDNGIFSVDGVITDFPLTSSLTRDCLAHLGKAAPNRVNLTIISKHGASGDYPSCTDLAYQKAISDGADFIDCTVQFSADKVPICLSNANLGSITTALQSKFSTRSETIKELGGLGVYSFNLTWEEIQTLTPVMLQPFFEKYKIKRNPRYSNAGKFMTLSDFLSLAKNSSSLSGVLIIIENARYLIGTKNITVDTLVTDALKASGIGNQTTKKVMIQSNDSSLLMKFKNMNYDLVYDIDPDIADFSKEALTDIKSFAQSIRISKQSIIATRSSYLEQDTSVVRQLGAANLPVYIETFSNEFLSQAWDFLSDPTYEINTYASYNITGVVTDYPATAARYRRNRCLNDNPPNYMLPVEPNDLLSSGVALPPAPPPLGELEVSDVVESPLPAAGSALPPTPLPTKEKSSGQKSLTISYVVGVLAAAFLVWI